MRTHTIKEVLVFAYVMIALTIAVVHLFVIGYPYLAGFGVGTLIIGAVTLNLMLLRRERSETKLGEMQKRIDRLEQVVSKQGKW